MMGMGDFSMMGMGASKSTIFARPPIVQFDHGYDYLLIIHLWQLFITAVATASSEM